MAYEAHGGGEPWDRLRPKNRRRWERVARAVMGKLDPLWWLAMQPRCGQSIDGGSCGLHRDHWGGCAPGHSVQLSSDKLAAAAFERAFPEPWTSRTRIMRESFTKFAQAVREVLIERGNLAEPTPPHSSELTPIARVGFEAYSRVHGCIAGVPHPSEVPAWEQAAESASCSAAAGQRNTRVLARVACAAFNRWDDISEKGQRAWVAFATAVVGECSPPAHTIDTVARVRWRPMPVQHRVYDARGLTLTYERYPGRASSNGGQ